MNFGFRINNRQIELLEESGILRLGDCESDELLTDILCKMRYIRGKEDMANLVYGLLGGTLPIQYCDFLVRLYFADIKKPAGNYSSRIYNNTNIKEFVDMLSVDVYEIKNRIDNLISWTDALFCDVVKRRVIDLESQDSVGRMYELDSNIIGLIVSTAFKCYAAAGYKKYIIKCDGGAFGMRTPLVMLDIDNCDAVVRMVQNGIYTAEQLLSLVNINQMAKWIKVSDLSKHIKGKVSKKYITNEFMSDLVDMGFIKLSESGQSYKVLNPFKYGNKESVECDCCDDGIDIIVGSRVISPEEIDSEQLSDGNMNKDNDLSGSDMTCDEKDIIPEENCNDTSIDGVVSICIRCNSQKECQDRMIDILDAMSEMGYRFKNSLYINDRLGHSISMKFGMSD